MNRASFSIVRRERISFFQFSMHKVETCHTIATERTAEEGVKNREKRKAFNHQIKNIMKL